MDIDKADQLFRDFKKSDESARRKHGLGFGSGDQPSAPTDAPPLPAALPSRHRWSRRDDDELDGRHHEGTIDPTQPSSTGKDANLPPFVDVAPSGITGDVMNDSTARGNKRHYPHDSDRSNKRQRRSRSPDDRWAPHQTRSLSRERFNGKHTTSQHQGRDGDRIGHRARSRSRETQRARPLGGGRGDGAGGGDDRWTRERVERGAQSRSPSRAGRSRSRSRSRHRDRDRTQRRSPPIQRRSPAVQRRRRSPSVARRWSHSLGKRDRSRDRREASDPRRRGSSPGRNNNPRRVSPSQDRRRRSPSLRDSRRRDQDGSPQDSRPQRSRSPGRGGNLHRRDGDRGRVSRRYSWSPRDGGRSRSPRRRSPSVSRGQRASAANRQREERSGRRSRSRGVEQQRRRERGEEGSGRGRDRSEGVQRLERKTALDFSKVIEGFDSMAPAQQLKAQTKYMLQQNTTRAKDTGGGQWTRLDLNSDALLEEEGAAPDMHFEELLKGAGPPTVASKRVAEHDALHADAIFGLPAQSTTANGAAHRPVRHVQPMKQAHESSSDSDDAPVVVDLGEMHDCPPEEQEPKPEIIQPASAPKLNWREKAAILRQERQRQEDLK